MSRLTEAHIRDLFLGFSRDYNQYKKSLLPDEFIKNQLTINLEYTLTSADSVLFNNPDAAEEAHRLLMVFWLARNTAANHEAPRTPRQSQPLGGSQYVYQKPTGCYCHRNSFLYDYLLLNAVMRPRPVYPVYAPLWGYWPFGSYHQHNVHSHTSHPGNRHGRREEQKKRDVSVLAILTVVALGALAFILVGVALYYLVQHMANDFERLFYNEGMMRSLIHLATTMASATAGMIFSGLFLSSSLITLGISAGMAAPIILAIVGVIVAGFVTASLGCYVGNKIQEQQLLSAQSDKMDPLEPQRFSLSSSEEALLETKGYDPLIVRAAMVALRSKIALIDNEGRKEVQKEGSTRPLPFFLDRCFGAQYQKDIQAALQQVRQIKQGKLRTIDVDGLHFDFRASSLALFHEPSAPPSSPPSSPSTSREPLYPELNAYQFDFSF